MIPFVDFAKQYEKISQPMIRRISAVMESGHFILGPEVLQLEERLAAYAGVKHCISCANGTDALQLVLMAWGIGKGDAVFVPSFTFMATAEVVALVGATPVFVDIDEDTYNLSMESLQHAIHYVKEKTSLCAKAVIPVDLFGLPADYDELERIAHEHDLLVLEDGAQSFGATYKDRKACSFGHAATTSFFPAKPLGCYGDGGAIFTNDAALNDLLRSLRFHGKGQDKYDNVRIGMNSRLDTIQAAVLLTKMDVFEQELIARRELARMYSNEIHASIVRPSVPVGMESAWAQYTIRLSSPCARLSLQEWLNQNGIPSMRYYPKPLHLQEAFSNHLIVPDECPKALTVSECVLSLPMHPYMDKSTATSIIDKINLIGAWQKDERKMSEQ